MVNFSFIVLLSLGILFLVSPSYQRGNLYVDTIYSSSGDVVTIDTLYGGDAEVTDSSANTVSFGNFDNVNLNAQRISLQGSFALLEGSTSVVIDSTAGEAAVSAGNAVNANSNTFNLNANQTAYFTSYNGEISLIAGDQFTSTSGGFNLQTDVGGVLLSSLAGDINLNSDGNFVINSNDELNLKTTYDIVFTTPSSVGVSASAGTADLESRNHIVFDSENSISLVSDGQRIGFNSGDFTVMNSNSFTATGDNQLKIQSFTSGIRMTSFGQTSFSSNSDLTLEGDTKGVSLFSNGASTGIIQLSSSTQSIYFTSQGKGDENTGILVNSDSVNANIVRTASFNSNDDGIIRGNGDITIKTGGSFGIDTQNFDSSSSKFTDMSTQFTLSGNNINVYAFNEATSGNANGLIDIYGDRIEYNSDLHASVHGGDVSFTADQGGVSLTSSSNVIISASRGDNDQHSIDMTSTNFTFTADDASIIGGEILLYGSQQVISVVYTVFITPEALTPNYVRFIATDDLYLSGDSLTHTSTDSLNFFSSFANGNSGQSGIYFTSDSTSVTSQLGYGITLISKGDFTTTATNVITQSLNADFSVTEDFALTTASSLQISAHSYKLQTYSLSFDSLDNNSTTNSQNIQFTSSSKIHFSTPRNEASDDTISANYANIDLSQQNLYFTGLNEGKFSAGYLTVESNDIIVSSDDRESMNLNVDSMTLTSTSDVFFTGDSVAISSLNSSFTSSSDTSFSITDDQRGLLLEGGAINVTAAQDAYITPDNILIDSLGNITFVNLNGSTNVAGSDSIAYSSENGALSLFANTTLSVISGHNIYLSTGDYSGDTLSISSTTFEITSTDSTSTSISNGNLAISTTNATITGSSVSFSGLGPLTVKTSVYTLDTETLATFGGNIDISSTVSTIDWTSSSFLINSTEGSIATQEVNKTTYEILFSAGGDISIATESTSGQFHATADRLEIFALNPTKATNLGDITINAPSVSLSSNLQNQFVQFTSGGLINITSAQDMTVQSSGDYFLEAKNSAQFYASGIQSATGGTFTFDAALNSCVNISHIGDTVNFVVQGSPSKFYNNLEVRSTDYIYTQAGDGSVLIESFGASFKRQNVDGESNGDFVFDEIVGISLRTRNEEGNIYFDSQQDTVDFVAQVDINVIALQTAYFYAINGQNYTSNGSTKFNAESGNITLRAGHDFNINANNNLYFLSSENTTLLAEDYIHMAAEQFEITSDSGDIYFNTYYNNDINILSDSISFTSGTSGMQFLAQGGIYFTADTTIDVNGARGVNLLTTVGPILFDSKNTVGISTSEELFVRSGGDIVTTSGTDTSFSGLGVAFTSTAADVNMQAQNFVLTSNTAILQSLGTSSTSRDRVYFNSPDIEYRSISAYIDATQLVQIGKATLPTVTIEATGNTAVPGVIFNVASSIDLSTNGVLAFTSLLGDHTLEAQAGATFDAARGISIETHNLQFNAIQGTFEMNAFSEISFTVNSTASIASDHSIFFSTTDSQLTDGIEFDFNTALTQSGHLLNIDLDETYSSQSLTLYLVSPKQGGIVRYETLGGDISVDSQTFFSVALKRTDLTAAGLMTLTTDSFSVTEVASSTNGVYFQSQGVSTYTGSGPYVVNAGYIDFLSSASSIDITSPLISINASGSFISNSTEQSNSISIANDLTMAINNYVQFTFEDLNNDLTVGNNFNLHSSIGKFNAGDDLQIDATTSSTLTAFQDLTFFSGQTLTISYNTALQGTFQSTLGNLYLTTTSKRSPISMASGTTSSIEAYSVGIRAGSEAERNSIAFNVGTTLTISDVQTSFIGNPTSIRSSTPVIVNVQAVTIDGSNLVVNASSAYEETGVVTIGNPLSLSPVAISGTTSLTLTSEDARIISEASSSISFTGPLVNMNTNGLDAFLRFDASSIIIGTTGTDATLTSTDTTRITSDNGVLSLSTTTLDLTTTGPADGDKLGIQFFADSSLSVSSTATTIAFNNDIFRMEALSQISITATTGSTYSGDSITLLSKGSRENPVGSTSGFYSATSYGTHYDFVGINIQSPSINLLSSGNIDFKSDLFYVPGAVTYSSNALPLISNYANGDFTASQLTVTSPSIRLLANSGIQFQNQDAVSVTTTTGSITIDASNDAVDSNILFSSRQSTVSISANSGSSINVNSNNLMLVEGQTTSSISSSGAMSFDATRGDILFRTIAPTDAYYSTTSPLQLSITVPNGLVSLSAGRSIRYISARIGFFSQPGDSQHANAYPGFASYNCYCGPTYTCSCPDTANRIIQMYQAFLDYGLLGTTLF